MGLRVITRRGVTEHERRRRHDWSAGPAADARRAKVLPRMEADPTGFPDSSGQGPSARATRMHGG
jgi:hypothetical protein